MPERDAGLRYQGSAQLPGPIRRRVARMLGIELCQSRDFGFERAPEPAERRGLLLGEFVLDEVGSSWSEGTGHRTIVSGVGCARLAANGRRVEGNSEQRCP